MSNLKEGTIKFREESVMAAEPTVVEQPCKQSRIDVLIERCNSLLRSVRCWYAEPSEAYSTVVGQPISPKSIVRVNVMSIILIVMALCAWQNVLVTGVTTACVGWLVYHAKGVKSSGSVSSKRKGGK